MDLCRYNFSSYVNCDSHKSMAGIRREMKRLGARIRLLKSWILIYLLVGVCLVYIFHSPKQEVFVDVQPIDNRNLDCEMLQKSRKSLLSQECKKAGDLKDDYIKGHTKKLLLLKSWLKDSRALVLEKEKAIYCFIPKVGCSSWKTKILENRGVIDSRNYTGKDTFRHIEAIQDVLADYGVKMLSEYKPSKAYQMLNTYFKFLFVRDPYERLLSAYRDKMGNPRNEQYRPDRERLLRLYKSKESVPSFSQFLGSLLKKPPRYYDVHWQPYDYICRPCLIDYDFVGKMETFLSDTSCVLPKLNMSSWFPRPRSARSSKNLVAQEFENVPLDIKQQISAIYKKDAELFGYSPLVTSHYDTQEHGFKAMV